MFTARIIAKRAAWLLPALLLTLAAPIRQSAAAPASGESEAESEAAKKARIAERRKRLEESRAKRRARKSDPGSRQKRSQEREKKRRARLDKAAKKLEERAAELRKQVAAGEVPKQSLRPGAPPASKERMLQQADQLETQAKKVRMRAEGRVPTGSSPASKGRGAGEMRGRAQKARRSHLRKRWGETLRLPEARQELRAHAQRVAKLKRIRSLAQRKKDNATSRKATMLLAKEQSRHESHMKELQARGATAASPSGASQQPSAAQPAENEQ